GNAFNLPEGIAVDTHVQRVSNRLGFSNSNYPEKIEVVLMANVPRERWTSFSHMMILHGRNVCKAIRPICSSCVLEFICPKIGVTKKA
ncbi:MAG: endonuclease III, partial [Chlamydiota bacterium]|nr:endonuclease III [Chlamydiota bacterium]